MKVNFALLCDYATVAADGKLSVMGIFSRIYASKIPAVHPQCYLAFEIELHYAAVGHPVKIRVQCVDTDGTALFAAHAVIETHGKGKIGDHPLLPQILKLPPLQLDKAGAYDFNIFLAESTTPDRTVSFEVLHAPAPGELPAGPQAGD